MTSLRTRALLALVEASIRTTTAARALTRKARTATAILAPAPPGSVGDHAMVGVLCAEVQGPKLLISLAAALDPLEVMPETDVVLAGRFFTGSVWSASVAALRVGRALGRARSLLVIGADVMDGAYSPWRSEVRSLLAGVAQRCGRSASIVNTSWNVAPAPRAVAALRKNPGVAIAARDPLSAQRLRAIGATNVRESADLAFCYDRESAPDGPLGDWLEQQGTAGRRIVVVNLNPSVADPDRLVALVSPSCRWLVEEGYSLLFVSHDRRNAGTGDLAALQRLGEAVPAGEHAFSWQAPSADAVRGLMKFVEFVISCRMHLIILAAGAAIPSIGFEYQGKMAGLFAEHLQMPDQVLDPAMLGADAVLTTVRAVAADRDRLSQLLAERLPGLRAQARRNW
jgi:polysaccharide pyruvyl transferase WcaK-like protein